MREYNKPVLEYVQLTSEEKFATGSPAKCITIKVNGACNFEYKTL